MDHRKMRRKLRTLAHKAHARFPNLNYGGCCVFAAAVATELERHGIRHEVISTGDVEQDLHELRPPSNTVEAWNSMGIGFGHMGVRLKLNGKWYTYDSEVPLAPGKRMFGRKWNGGPFYRSAKGGLTAAEATELADEPEWNRMFHNAENVNAVRQMVAEHFA